MVDETNDAEFRQVSAEGSRWRRAERRDGKATWRPKEGEEWPEGGGPEYSTRRNSRTSLLTSTRLQLPTNLEGPEDRVKSNHSIFSTPYLNTDLILVMSSPSRTGL